MSHSKTKFQVGDFVFLSANKVDLLTPELFSTLLKDQVLTNEDQEISEEILNSLENSGTLPFHWSPQESDWMSKNDPSKWLEYIIYRFKFRLYPKRKIVPEFPIYLLIEPTSACNLRCPMCFQADKTFTNTEYMGQMKYELFTKIIDEAVEKGTKALTMSSRGEPTLNRDFGKMVTYASGKFLELKIITNATKLSEKLSHEILMSGVNLLVFSIDAHTKDVYEKYRVSITGKGNFEAVRDNVQKFHEIRKQDYPNSKIVTRISGVQVGEDQDPEGFNQFWQPVADEVGMKPAYERWDTYNNEKHPENTSPCRFVWERLYVWHDGQTNVCDADYKSKLETGSISIATNNTIPLINDSEYKESIANKGDLSSNSISDIWHGAKLRQLRKDHLDGNRSYHNPCDRCGIS
jgi:organic radical activating enzyme